MVDKCILHETLKKFSISVSVSYFFARYENAVGFRFMILCVNFAEM